MKNKKLLLIIGIIFGMMILSDSVIAVSALNLDSILHPFISVNVANFYMRYSAFIDAIIYLILFLSVAQIAFLKVYKETKKEAKLVAVAVSLALTVSMILFEMNTGFYLGKLYPIALFVILAVLGILLYNLLLGLFTGTNGKSVSAAFTYLIIYGLFIVPFNVLNDWVIKSAPFLASILVLGALVSFIYLLIQMFSALDFKSDSTPGGTTPGGTTPGGTTPTPPTPPVPPTPLPYPDALKNTIDNDYSNAINILPTALNNYATHFNAMIGLHHTALAPGGAEPTPAHWVTLATLRSDLNTAIENANIILNGIRTSPDYARLNAADVSTLHYLMTRHGNVINALLRYEVLARDRYNTRGGVPPMPII